MARIALIALGGALGAVSRYLVSGLVLRGSDGAFPWGTLVVNWSGCLAVGLLWAAAERAPVPPGGTALVFVGFLGAYSTFSTFGLETMNLLRDGETVLAFANMLLSAVGGVALTFGGFHLGRILFSP